MAHEQKPDSVFRRNVRVHLNRWGASVLSTTGSLGVRISGSNAGDTMFRGSVKCTGYPLHSHVSPSLSRQCVTVCHHISTGVYLAWRPLNISDHISLTSSWSFLKFRTGVIEKVKTRFTFYNLKKNRAIYEMMWKNIVELVRPQTTIRCMRVKRQLFFRPPPSALFLVLIS